MPGPEKNKESEQPATASSALETTDAAKIVADSSKKAVVDQADQSMPELNASQRSSHRARKALEKGKGSTHYEQKGDLPANPFKQEGGAELIKALELENQRFNRRGQQQEQTASFVEQGTTRRERAQEDQSTQTDVFTRQSAGMIPDSFELEALDPEGWESARGGGDNFDRAPDSKRVAPHPTGTNFDGQVTVTTAYSDGSKTVDHKDGEAVYAMIPQPDKSVVHVADSKDPASKFLVVEKADHTWTAFENKKPLALSSNPQVAADRDHLCKSLEKKITDSEHLAKFRADLAKFECSGASPKEMSAVYREMSRLLDSPKAHVSDAQRTQLVREVISQSAHPFTIDQGRHNTCNVTTVEAKLYHDSPSRIAKVVSDVALTGRYEYAPGKVVTLDQPVSFTHMELDNKGKPVEVPRQANAMVPDAEASRNYLSDGSRSYASQLFQMAAINAVYDEDYGNKWPLEKMMGAQPLHYVQFPPDSRDPSGGIEEALIEKGKILSDSPRFGAVEIARAYRMFSGTPADHGIVIVDKRRVADEALKDKTITCLESQKQFEDALKDAKKNHKLPVILAVDSLNEPFYTDSGRGTAGGSGGGHVVLITDYSPGPPAKVTMDNQWGSANDHGKGHEVSVRQMYICTMRYKDATVEWRKQADAAKAAGGFDLESELELLRRDRNDQSYMADHGDKLLPGRVGNFVRQANDHFSHHKDEPARQELEQKFRMDFMNWSKNERKMALAAMGTNPSFLSKAAFESLKMYDKYH